MNSKVEEENTERVPMEFHGMLFLPDAHLERRCGMDADFGLFPAVTLVTAQRPDGAVRGRVALLLQEGVERPCVSPEERRSNTARSTPQRGVASSQEEPCGSRVLARASTRDSLKGRSAFCFVL